MNEARRPCAFPSESCTFTERAGFWDTEAFIVHEFPAVHTPRQNGLAEHFNRTIKGRIHAILVDCTLWTRHWPYALTAEPKKHTGTRWDTQLFFSGIHGSRFCDTKQV